MTGRIYRRVLLLAAALVLVVCAAPVGVSSAHAEEPCINEQRRAEQPYGLGLPDCRAFEMVSPLDKSDNDAIALNGFIPIEARSSLSGGAFTYNSFGAFAHPVTSRLTSQYVARRGSDGWSTQNISPATGSNGNNADLEGSPFSDLLMTPELTSGVASVATTTGTATLASDAPEGYTNLYVANFASNTYQTVTNVLPPGIPPNEFYNPYAGTAGQNDPYPAGASTDLGHVFFEEHSNLTPGAPANVYNVYEWTDGRLSLVNVNNNGEAMTGGALPGAGEPENSFDGPGADQWHSFSSDGSRAFFTSPLLSEEEQEEYQYSRGAEQPVKPQLYVRENPGQPQSPLNGQGECTVPADGCTVEVSASQRSVPDPNGPRSAFFVMANANGSKVFFTSNVELTNDANTGSADNAANLYEYDLENGKLNDLTVDTKPSDKNGAAVLGAVEESEDGSYVYFVAEGALTGNAVSGQPNLYLFHGGATTYIATLSATADFRDWEDEAHLSRTHPAGSLGRRVGPTFTRARVTPDGTHFAFLSIKSLTGYDNEPVEPTECESENIEKPTSYLPSPCVEVFSYDAGNGSLVCASCDPNGARPVGPASFSGGSNISGSQALFYMPRNFSEDGSRLFFQSPDALVPHDSNGVGDVYEYENGHVFPVSDTAGNSESYFLDASPNGNDVFIGTADQLLPQDTDFRIDVYDARAGGGFPVQSAPPPCTNGDACKPPVSPQPGVFGAPASATFAGAGNVPSVAAKPVVKKKRKPKPKTLRHGKKRAKAIDHGGKTKASGNVSPKARRSRGGRGR